MPLSPLVNGGMTRGLPGRLLEAGNIGALLVADGVSFAGVTHD
jgi:hypothetical protein